MSEIELIICRPTTQRAVKYPVLNEEQKKWKVIVNSEKNVSLILKLKKQKRELVLDPEATLAALGKLDPERAKEKKVYKRELILRVGPRKPQTVEFWPHVVKGSKVGDRSYPARFAEAWQSKVRQALEHKKNFPEDNVVLKVDAEHIEVAEQLDIIEPTVHPEDVEKQISQMEDIFDEDDL